MKDNNIINAEFLGISFEGRTDIPTLHIEATYEKGEKRERFLTPFRKYRFQVSATIDGEGDCGSSPITMFSDLSHLDKSITTSILWSAAVTALYNFSHTGNTPGLAHNDLWIEFIDLCHRWIYGKDSNLLVFKRTAVPKEKKMIVS